MTLFVTSFVAIIAGDIRVWIRARSSIGFNPHATFIAEAVITAMTVFWIELVIYEFLRTRHQHLSS
jgi:hypothetical protein